jgi:hypothetical protein
VKLEKQYGKHNNYQVGLMCHAMHMNKNKNNFKFELWSYPNVMSLEHKIFTKTKVHPP